MQLWRPKPSRLQGPAVMSLGCPLPQQHLEVSRAPVCAPAAPGLPKSTSRPRCSKLSKAKSGRIPPELPQVARIGSTCASSREEEFLQTLFWRGWDVAAQGQQEPNPARGDGEALGEPDSTRRVNSQPWEQKMRFQLLVDLLVCPQLALRTQKKMFHSEALSIFKEQKH